MSVQAQSRRSLAAAAILLLGLFGNRAMGQAALPTTEPSIVFVGVVDTPGAVTLPSLTAAPNMSVVSVERIIRKPDAVTLGPGDKVTVVTEGAGPQRGVRALFLTHGWMFGESIAVRVQSWEPVSATATAAAATADEQTRVTAQLQAAADNDLRASLGSADLVVTGRVRRVQPPSVAALAPERRRITEHDPEWQEAVVEVQSALKGAAEGPEVVVRFPASMDVMWAAHPKLREGQEGTFILNQDRVSGAPMATLEGGRTTPAYTITSPRHLLSTGDAVRVRTLLGR